MTKNMMLMGMRGFYQEELRNLLAEVVVLRAHVGENARTISAAESLLEISRTQLQEIKTQLGADMRRDTVGVPGADAPVISSC